MGFAEIGVNTYSNHNFVFFYFLIILQSRLFSSNFSVQIHGFPVKSISLPGCIKVQGRWIHMQSIISFNSKESWKQSVHQLFPSNLTALNFLSLLFGAALQMSALGVSSL